MPQQLHNNYQWCVNWICTFIFRAFSCSLSRCGVDNTRIGVIAVLLPAIAVPTPQEIITYYLFLISVLVCSKVTTSELVKDASFIGLPLVLTPLNSITSVIFVKCLLYFQFWYYYKCAFWSVGSLLFKDRLFMLLVNNRNIHIWDFYVIYTHSAISCFVTLEA